MGRSNGRAVKAEEMSLGTTSTSTATTSGSMAAQSNTPPGASSAVERPATPPHVSTTPLNRGAANFVPGSLLHGTKFSAPQSQAQSEDPHPPQVVVLNRRGAAGNENGSAVVPVLVDNSDAGDGAASGRSGGASSAPLVLPLRRHSAGSASLPAFPGGIRAPYVYGHDAHHLAEEQETGATTNATEQHSSFGKPVPTLQDVYQNTGLFDDSHPESQDRQRVHQDFHGEQILGGRATGAMSLAINYINKNNAPGAAGAAGAPGGRSSRGRKSLSNEHQRAERLRVPVQMPRSAEYITEIDAKEVLLWRVPCHNACVASVRLREHPLAMAQIVNEEQHCGAALPLEVQRDLQRVLPPGNRPATRLASGVKFDQAAKTGAGAESNTLELILQGVYLNVGLQTISACGSDFAVRQFLDYIAQVKSCEDSVLLPKRNSVFISFLSRVIAASSSSAGVDTSGGPDPSVGAEQPPRGTPAAPPKDRRPQLHFVWERLKQEHIIGIEDIGVWMSKVHIFARDWGLRHKAKQFLRSAEFAQILESACVAQQERARTHGQWLISSENGSPQWLQPGLPREAYMLGGGGASAAAANVAPAPLSIEHQQGVSHPPPHRVVVLSRPGCAALSTDTVTATSLSAAVPGRDVSVSKGLGDVPTYPPPPGPELDVAATSSIVGPPPVQLPTPTATSGKRLSLDKLTPPPVPPPALPPSPVGRSFGTAAASNSIAGPAPAFPNEMPPPMLPNLPPPFLNGGTGGVVRRSQGAEILALLRSCSPAEATNNSRRERWEPVSPARDAEWLEVMDCTSDNVCEQLDGEEDDQVGCSPQASTSLVLPAIAEVAESPTNKNDVGEDEGAEPLNQECDTGPEDSAAPKSRDSSPHTVDVTALRRAVHNLNSDKLEESSGAERKKSSFVVEIRSREDGRVVRDGEILSLTDLSSLDFTRVPLEMKIQSATQLAAVVERLRAIAQSVAKSDGSSDDTERGIGTPEPSTGAISKPKVAVTLRYEDKALQNAALADLLQLEHEGTCTVESLCVGSEELLITSSNVREIVTEYLQGQDYFSAEVDSVDDDCTNTGKPMKTAAAQQETASGEAGSPSTTKCKDRDEYGAEAVKSSVTSSKDSSTGRGGGSESLAAFWSAATSLMMPTAETYAASSTSKRGQTPTTSAPGGGGPGLAQQEDQSEQETASCTTSANASGGGEMVKEKNSKVLGALHGNLRIPSKMDDRLFSGYNARNSFSTAPLGGGDRQAHRKAVQNLRFCSTLRTVQMQGVPLGEHFLGNVLALEDDPDAWDSIKAKSPTDNAPSTTSLVKTTAATSSSSSAAPTSTSSPTAAPGTTTSSSTSSSSASTGSSAILSRGRPSASNEKANGLNYMPSPLVCGSLQRLHLRSCEVGNRGARVVARYLLGWNGRAEVQTKEQTKQAGICVAIEAGEYIESDRCNLAIAVADRARANLCTTSGATTTSLQSLSLVRQQIDSQGCFVLARALSGPEQHLVDLNLSQNDIGLEGGEALGHMLKVNESLRKLTLIKCSLDDGAAEALGAGLATNGSLHALRLCSNEISSDGVSRIAKALRTSKPVLRVLDLAHNRVGVPGAVALAGSLAKLRVLLLDGNSMLQDRGVSAIVSSAGFGDKHSDSGLVALGLSDCGASAAAGEHVAPLLRRTRTLRCLRLGGNALGPSGLDCFQTLGPLKRLELQRCGLGDAGSMALARLLRGNKTLTELRLQQNGIGSEGGKLIAGALQDSRSGVLTRLMLQHNFLGEEVLSMLDEIKIKRIKEQA